MHFNTLCCHGDIFVSVATLLSWQCIIVTVVIGFHVGNFARVVDGPHEDLYGKVRGGGRERGREREGGGREREGEGGREMKGEGETRERREYI